MAALVGLAFAVAVVWWAVAAETRSLDRRLDIAGQTLVEELRASLNEVERDLTALGRLLSVRPPTGPAEFAHLATDHVPAARAVALATRTADDLSVSYSTDLRWLATGADPSRVVGWDQLRMVGISSGLSQYLPTREGDPPWLVVWESVGFPGTWTEGGALIMAVEIEPLVATTGVSMTDGGPTVAVRELDPGEELATSGPLLHREYFFVGDRRWLFEISPRQDSAYAVDWTIPIGAGVLAIAVAATAWLATSSRLRRHRIARELAIASASSDDKDRFLLALSHQIRTPLTAVVGFLDVLRTHDDLADDESAEFLNRAADHAEEISAIVHDILIVTRDDLDLLVVTAQPTNPVREAMAVASSVPLGDAIIEIIPDVRDAPAALGDPVRVRQIIRNLVANAIRHGGRSVHISVHRRAAEVVVTVADDGPGLAADLAESLQRNGPSAFDARRQDSLGLGLKVIWLLAERMHGRVEYRRSGSLTMFELILPAADIGSPTLVSSESGSRREEL